ncbi:MAG: outer membrane protein assembly factor BamE [Burkholderiaceae bacterium]|nr:outer membrane protein assembly factor BamE [Burkholderiaceae bacterium]
MNAGMFITGHAVRVAVVVLAGLLATGVTQARSNPVDPISNPNGLEYSDIKMNIPDYDEPFRRDGVMSRTEVFRQIKSGVLGNEVEALIGKPLNESSVREWNYTFKFVLPQSKNYMVCQYKVVFDSAQKVLETVWRREQCLDIVSTGSAG